MESAKEMSVTIQTMLFAFLNLVPELFKEIPQTTFSVEEA
jgi:hypothetical protein